MPNTPLGTKDRYPRWKTKIALIVSPIDFSQPSPVADELASAERLFSLTASQPNRVTSFVGINHTAKPCLVRRYAMQCMKYYPSLRRCPVIPSASYHSKTMPIPPRALASGSFFLLTPPFMLGVRQLYR